MIKNQFGRRNLVPYVRVELALKLEGPFQKKALENKVLSGESFGINSYELPKKVCQNSDKVIKEVKSKNADNCSCQNSDKSMPDHSQSVDFIENIDEEEELPIPRSENIYERAEQALKLTEAFHKKPPEIKPIDTKRELAQIAGVSHDTIERVKTIQEKAPEEVLQKVKTGEISINQAYITIKREEKEQKRNEEVKENTEKVSRSRSIDDLKGLFKTIVIDPPWDSHASNIINFTNVNIDNNFADTNFSFIKDNFVHSVRTSSSFNLKISIDTGYSSYDVTICIYKRNLYFFDDFSCVWVDDCS